MGMYVSDLMRWFLKELTTKKREVSNNLFNYILGMPGKAI